MYPNGAFKQSCCCVNLSDVLPVQVPTMAPLALLLLHRLELVQVNPWI